MEEYLKVIVCTPMDILERVEPFDSKISPEDMLYRMLDSKAWIDEGEYQASNLFHKATTEVGIPAYLHAAYVAFYIGFSVFYEMACNGQTVIVGLISKCVTKEHIEFIKKHLENKNAYLEYVTCFGENVGLEFARDTVSNYSGLDLQTAYQITLQKMLEVMSEHQMKWEEGKEEIKNVR